MAFGATKAEAEITSGFDGPEAWRSVPGLSLRPSGRLSEGSNLTQSGQLMRRGNHRLSSQ